jgi:hypothetical protein
MAMTCWGVLLDHGSAEPRHEPAVQDEKVLPPSVGLKGLCAGVKQPTVNLDDEFDFVKDHIDVAGGVT